LSPALRNTGIRVLGDTPWGMHSCVFYQSKEDLLDTAIDYFRAGLDSNEFCLWVVSDPVTETDAEIALRRGVPNFSRYLAAGQIEIIRGRDWYLNGDLVDSQWIIGRLNEKLTGALGKGFEGLRASGNAFWLASIHWREFCAYEQEVNHSLADKNVVVLCTYPLEACRGADLLDVTRTHQSSVTRRNGKWEILEAPDLNQAKEEIRRLSGALDVLSKAFPGHELLTPRERVVLAQIVRGASNKEIGRVLSIGTRTVEFHRANIMQKIGAKNTADLVRKVLWES
jgi:DNA-binding CsgD family transcriptional regulator